MSQKFEFDLNLLADDAPEVLGSSLAFARRIKKLASTVGLSPMQFCLAISLVNDVNKTIWPNQVKISEDWIRVHNKKENENGNSGNG